MSGQKVSIWAVSALKLSRLTLWRPSHLPLSSREARGLCLGGGTSGSGMGPGRGDPGALELSSAPAPSHLGSPTSASPHGGRRRGVTPSPPAPPVRVNGLT